MAATTINTKVYIRPGQQVRRLRLSPETSFETFRALILNAFESSPLVQLLQEYDAQFLYLDDEEDWISINTEQEFRDALSYFESGDELFRVKAVLVTKQKQQQQQQHVQQQHPLFQRFHCRPHPNCFRRAASQFEPASGLLNGFFDVLNHQNRSSESPVNDKKQPASSTKNPVDSFSGFLNELFDVLIETEKPESQTTQSESKSQSREIPIDEYNQVPVENSVTQESDVATHNEESEQQLINTTSESAAEEKQEESHTTVPPQPDQSFQQELQSLESMGFTNKQLNVHLLKHHKGDLVKVVSQLLELTH
jgi:hypothetical protein